MQQVENQEIIKEKNKACVMKIRGILHSRGKSITAMEAELGFGNGSVGKWASGVRRPPLERLLQIAEYLEVSVEELYPGIVKTKMPAAENASGQDEEELMEEIMQTIRSRPEMRMLFDAGKKATPETVRQTARFLEGLAKGENAD